MGHAVAVTETSTPSAAILREDDRRDWRRHPVDVARLVWRLVVLLGVLGLTAAFPSALTNVSADLVRLFARMPEPLRYALVGLAQLTLVVVPVVIVGWLITQRTRLAALLVVGSATVGGGLMLLLTDWLQRVAPPAAITDLPSNSFLPTDVPSIAFLAALTSGAATASPMMATVWKRAAWGVVILAATVRALSATQAPVGIAVTLALGSAIGSLALAVFGSPRRRPGSATLRSALSAGSVEVDQLADEEHRAGVRSYRAALDGHDVEIQFVYRDDRDVELLSRVWGAVRVRNVEEQRLSIRPRTRAAQHAVVSDMAERAGVRVPDVLAVVPAPRDSAVVVLDPPEGTSLAEMGSDGVSDAALDDVWAQVDGLHTARIAHRALTSDHVVIDGDRAALRGLDDALVASGAETRAVDRAELLVSMAVAVGVERALDAAVRSVSAARLEAALPFVQIPALPPATQRIAKRKHHKGLVDALRSGLQQRLGVEEVELAELERVSIAKIVSWIGFDVLAFFVLTLVTSWSEIVDAMSGINGVWLVPVFVATIFGTFGEATVVMFGQSFLNRFTPMNAGGMAMRIRYLQKGGTDPTVATAAIGLTSAASGVMQVVFIAFCFLWSSSDPTSGLSLRGDDGGDTDVSVVVLFVVAVIVAVIVVAVTPRIRRWLVDFVRSTIEKLRADFGALLRMPAKLGLLFGGATVAKLSTIVAFAAACRAFDIDPAFAQLGALYMAANTVASAVPTPGGVGAVEAALVFVLTNAGVDDAAAWAAVLLFRLVNYWFPTIPGYVALRVSERRQLV